MLKLKNFKDRDFSVTRCDKTSILEKDTYFWLAQKCVRSYNEFWKKKYFINVYICDYRLWDIYYKMKNNVPFIKRSFTIKLNLERNGLDFWIQISKDKEFQSVQDIELICEEVWNQLDCDYYEE